MARVLSQGRYFVTTRSGLRPDSPRFDRGTTVEISRPYRMATPRIIRYWGDRALVLGKWVETDWDETTALMKAMQATRRPDLDDEVVDWINP